MSKLKLIKANIKIWYFKKEEKKPFNKKMKDFIDVEFVVNVL